MQFIMQINGDEKDGSALSFNMFVVAEDLNSAVEKAKQYIIGNRKNDAFSQTEKLYLNSIHDITDKTIAISDVRIMEYTSSIECPAPLNDHEAFKFIPDEFEEGDNEDNHACEVWIDFNKP